VCKKRLQDHRLLDQNATMPTADRLKLYDEDALKTALVMLDPSLQDLTQALLDEFHENILASGNSAGLPTITDAHKSYTLTYNLNIPLTGRYLKMLIEKQTGIPIEEQNLLIQGHIAPEDTPLDPDELRISPNIHLTRKPRQQPAQQLVPGTQATAEHVGRATMNTNRTFNEGDWVIIKRRGQFIYAQIASESNVDPGMRGIFIPIRVEQNQLRTVTPDEITGKL